MAGMQLDSRKVSRADWLANQAGNLRKDYSGPFITGDEPPEEEAALIEPIEAPPDVSAGVEPPSPAMGALEQMMAPPSGPNEQYGFDPETPLDAPIGMRSIEASSRALAELIASRGGRAY